VNNEDDLPFGYKRRRDGHLDPTCAEYKKHLAENPDITSAILAERRKSYVAPEEETESAFIDGLLRSGLGDTARSREEAMSLAPYNKPLESGMGMSQAFLGNVWNITFKKNAPHFPGLGFWELPLFEYCFRDLVKDRTVEALGRFAFPGVTLTAKLAVGVFHVKTIFCLGISDGTLWNEGTLKGLLEFWLNYILPWWAMALDSYFYARNEADRISEGFMALRNTQHREQLMKARSSWLAHAQKLFSVFIAEKQN